MKEKYPNELQQFYDDLENETEIKKLKEYKSVLQTKIQSCDSFRKSNRAKIQIIHTEIGNLKQEKEGYY